MATQITCTACKGKLRIPSHFQGRIIKCPICSATLKTKPKGIEIELTDSDVVESAPQPKSISLPLLSFEELKIPSRMQTLINSVMEQREQLLWLGRPDFGQIYRQSWIAAPFGLIFAGIGAGVLFLTTRSDFFDKLPAIVLILCVALLSFFIVVGSALMLMPLWACLFRNQRDCYALTDRKAILVGYAKEAGVGNIFKCSRVIYTPEQLDNMKLKGNNLVFEEYVQFGSPEKKNSLLSKLQNRHYGDDEFSVKYQAKQRGFLYLDNAEDVEKLIRQTLLR